METAFEAMKAAAGPGGWIDDPALLAPYLTDWRGRKTGSAPLLLRPATAAAVQAIVRIAAAHRVGLVPQGGNTSLCGASVPEPEGGAVLLSLQRLNRIRSVDPGDDSLVAEAGVTLQAVHDAGLQGHGDRRRADLDQRRRRAGTALGHDARAGAGAGGGAPRRIAARPTVGPAQGQHRL
jgi:hypothetical protein